MQITEHFSREEFAQHAAHGFQSVPYPEEWIDSRLKPLCEVLEAIRAKLGKPISIMSGYRTPEYNESIHGAKNSQHCQGRAADIRVSGIAASAVHAVILSMYKSGEINIGGLGKYNSFVHVDIRYGTTLAQWNRSGEDSHSETADGNDFGATPVVDSALGVIQGLTSDDAFLIAGISLIATAVVS